MSSLYTHFLRNIVLPIGSNLVGYGEVMPHLRRLERSQWWSPQEIRELQNRKLRRLIHHVYRHVPFYRRVFDERGLTPDDIRTTDDLVKLPIVDKRIITRHYQEEMRDHSIPKSKLIHATSSGSTGEKLQYWTTRRQKAMKWAGMFRWWELTGYEFGKPYATFQVSPNRGLVGLPVLEKLEWLMLRHTWITPFVMNEEIFDNYVRELENSKAVMLRAYASVIYYLSRYMVEHGYNVHIPAITTTGETLTPHMRETIEQAFAPGRVFDDYGADGMQIAAECDHHDGMHINAETVFVEIIRDGERVPEGELGEIVLTNLDATAVPFIRYNVQDVGILDTSPCACGRGLPRFSHVEGRLTDMFVTPDGHWLSVHQFTGFFSKFKPVRAFQVIQKEVDLIVVKMVVEEGYTEEDERTIRERFRQYVGPDTRFLFEYVDEIPATPTGKRRFFISEVITGTENTLGPVNRP
ncbi:MAG: phenylacetate--CoA ligase family protein [Caldilineae bacterium]|nr:MAG: phenylacetate--CoA ligase family protein [Caldilineae bacterium]